MKVMKVFFLSSVILNNIIHSVIHFNVDICFCYSLSVSCFSPKGPPGQKGNQVEYFFCCCYSSIWDVSYLSIISYQHLIVFNLCQTHWAVRRWIYSTSSLDPSGSCYPTLRKWRTVEMSVYTTCLSSQAIYQLCSKTAQSFFSSTQPQPEMEIMDYTVKNENFVLTLTSMLSLPRVIHCSINHIHFYSSKYY